MLWLDIINCFLTSIVIYLTSVGGEKKIQKKKSTVVKSRKKTFIIITLLLSLIGQIGTLFVNKEDRKIADDNINQLKADLITYQKRVDTAIMQRDTTIQLAQKGIDAFLDSLEKRGVHYDRETGKVEIKIQNQNQQININQNPLLKIDAEYLNFENNKFNNQIHVNSPLPKPH